MSDRLALVTGGAGFIGSHLVEALLARGFRVRVLDDFSSGERGVLPADGVEVVEGDVRDRDAVAASVRGAHLVFHLAALVSVPDSFDDPRGCYETNVVGTLNLLAAAHQAGVERVILASSAAVYGEADGPVAEDAPKSPQSPYAASKLAMEEAALLYHKQHRLPVVCLRYFNVYGPHQRPDSPYAAVIPAFIQAGLEGRAPVIDGDGEQRRDFVFVADAVRANLLAAEAEGAVGGVFNIGGDDSVSINQLARNLQVVLPKGPDPLHGPPRKGDIRFSKADWSGAKRVLGYQPGIDLLAGLRLTVEWYAQQRAKADA